MNKAIVICYTGRQIRETEKAAIENIISNACDATQNLIITTQFDEKDVAKILLNTSVQMLLNANGHDAKIVSTVDEEASADIIAEARQKAVSLIKSKYNSLTGVIAFAKDVATAKYHLRVNAADDDEINLVNAMDVIADIPQSLLTNKYRVSKSLCDAIFQLRDL